jgi:glutathione S-transferase
MANLQRDADARIALEQGGGRVKVPCLRIEHEDGRIEWMYESSDINAYLRHRFEP